MSVRCIQLAHNVRDPKTGYPKAKVLFNFGREEDLTGKEALVRLVKSITRFWDRKRVYTPGQS
ncbi:MAG: hypothetical protein PWP41_927 [Moorella sp. (in: firmicutes)]|nr:hypothetical protein [Moorella sp. (in: firmicutes)]